MNGMIWIWLGAAAVFGIVEAATAGLVSIWFAIGAVAALIAAILGGGIAVQAVVFLAVSALTLALTWPLVRKTTAGKVIPTNLDRTLGAEAKVTETIDNENATGAVYVDGKSWTARSEDGSVLPAGTIVCVKRMEGVKLFVEKCKEMTEVSV